MFKKIIIIKPETQSMDVEVQSHISLLAMSFHHDLGICQCFKGGMESILCALLN